MSDRAAVFKRALTEIETLRRRVAELEAAAKSAPATGPQERAEPVAVIGMACRLPGGVTDPDGFWDLLARGVDATCEVPADRWPANGLFSAEPAPGKVYVQRGGYLEDVAGFDPAFFGLSPRETQRMDPQQRLLLETSWEALERAGQSIDALVGSATGVFVGNTTSDFSHLQMKYVDLALLDAHYLTGNFPSFLAGRIAFHFGLQGPVLAVDTACSSSLVAVHLACQSLGQGECELALASGVNLMLLPELNASLCGARMLAPDGRCKTFDARADGYARAEGCATVVLKRLADAEAADDPILAIIRGSAINHDGQSSGITVPNGAAQQKVLRRALARAGVRPGDVDYVEAHGTGTALGDPIEVRALTAVLGEDRQAPLLLGSVKTNVGHLEAAAGIAGLIKVILALELGEVPPHLNLDVLNPAIDLEAIPAQVATEKRAWPARDGGPRIAGVSSFGASGTNAHVVLTSASATEAAPESGHDLAKRHLLALSAQDETALRQLAGRFAEHLTVHPEQALADVCRTANVGRPPLRHRLALHDTTASGMAARLAAVAAVRAGTDAGPAAVPGVSLSALPRRASRWGKAGAPIAFLFTGQGAQYPDMGRVLYDTEPVFRQVIERCDAGLRDVLEQPLLDVLYGSHHALLDQTAYTQPALFAVEYALAETWRAWGVTPAAVLGHSVGEYVAACVAGVLDFDQGLHLIATRARLMQALPVGGAMAAVALDEEAACAAIADRRDTLAIAAINGPRSVVLSGDREALDAVIADLAARKVKTQRLKVSHAFHSPRMEPMLDALEAAVAGFQPAPPQVDLIANLTGKVIDGQGGLGQVGLGHRDLGLRGGATDSATGSGSGSGSGNGIFGSADYWRRHAREPVRFADGVASLAALGIDVLLEVGPAPTLLGMARQCTTEGDDKRAWVPSLRKGRDDRQQMLSGVAELFVQGAAIDWQRVDGGRRRQRVALPTYPFQRRRFWIESHELATSGNGASGGPREATSCAGIEALHPFLFHRLPSPLAGAQYAAVYGIGCQPLLGDFALFGHVVVNIGVYVEAFAAAARDAVGVAVPVIDDIAMPQALLLGDGVERLERAVQVVVSDARDGERTLELFALPAESEAAEQGSAASSDRPWTLYASGRLLADADADSDLSSLSLETLRASAATELQGEVFYSGMEARGLKLGPAGRWIDHVWRAGGEPAVALARMRPPTEADDAARFGLHPGIIDCCFQLLYATLTTAENDPQALFMLVGVERLQFFGWPAEATPDDAPCRDTACRDTACRDTALWCHVQRDVAREGDEAGHVVAGDIALVTAAGQPVLKVTGAELRRVDRESLERSLSHASTRRVTAGSAAATGTTGSEATRRAALEALREAAPHARQALACDGVAAAVAQVLGFAVADVDLEQPLSELGFDSLLALELRTAIGNRLGVAPPLARILERPTPRRLAARLLADIVPSEDADCAAQPATTDQGDGVEAVDESLPAVVADPAHRYDPFPLTDLQEAYFFGRTGAFELGNISTYVTLEVEIDGLDVERLDAAWQRMIERHDMLRAVFLADGRQQVLPRAPESFAIRYHDLAELDEAARAEALVATRQEMVSQVLPTAGWPLFDLRVSHLGGGRCRLHVGLDALVMDAWGHSILFKEWAAVYRQPTCDLASLEVSFRDYALALKELEKTAVYERDLAYWQARLVDLPPAPELPLVCDPSSLAFPDFVRHTGRLEAPAWERLQSRAAAAGLTPSTMMCAVYAAVLAEWSKSRRFTLNILYFNRLPLHPRANEIAANLSATILLAVDARQALSFLEYAQALARRFWDDLQHSHVSGVRVLRDYNRMHAGRSQAGMPVVFASTLAIDVRQDDVPSGLFQHLLGLGGDGAVVHATARTPQVMLDHQIMEEAGALVFNWDAVDALFPPGLVADMFAAYCTLLEDLAADESAWHRPIGDARHGLVPVAQQSCRAAVNATERPIARGLLHEPFLAQARSHPERPAVIAADRTIDYGELSGRAHALAHRLRDAGVRPSDLVGVVLEKGWPQVVATLAVGLAGGAYLPIDPGLPPSRVRYLLDHGQVRVALLFGDVDPLAVSDEGWPAGVVRLSVDPEPPAEVPAMLEPVQAATDLAYVIFTSGSTGLPKGVMIDHRGALNTVLDVNRRFAIGPQDRVLALSALNFDLSVWDIFGLLAAGGALVMPPPDALREPGCWTALIDAHQVTVWNSVPALMEMWVDSRACTEDVTSGLRLVMMSGDWIPVTLPDRIRSMVADGGDGAGIEVVSLGGATEASIWSILYPIGDVDPAWSSIPYGRPMANQQFHVLDPTLRSRPDWVPGELYIAGIGVAQGYLRDAERTATSFLEHPVTGERLYRTGDLGRYLPDGTIEFLGREDFQVKIQGYRIELGEIEVALARHPAVAQCVVVAQGAKHGSKRLVAFVVPAANAAGTATTGTATTGITITGSRDAGISAAEPGGPAAPEVLAESLGRWLGDQIASYMVPSAFVVVEALPLSANGKIARGALAAYDTTAAAAGEASEVAPRDAVEAELAALWGSLLEREAVGVHDDFFELGGHSLLAVRLMAAIESRFGRQLSLATIFEGRTVEHLAALLRRGPEETSSAGQEIVVTIQAPAPQAARPALFCVHPVSGSVLCYAPLARALGQDQAFFGLQSPVTLDGADDLEQLAAAYLEAVRSVQPQGPYHLAGWSMGGMVAYEMARQLAAVGETAAFVGLIDVAEPPAGPSATVDDATLVSWFARDLAGLVGQESTFDAAWLAEVERAGVGELDAADGPVDGPADGLGGDGRRLAALATWAEAAGVLPLGIGLARLRDLYAVFQRNYRALLAYRPTPHDGTLTVFHVEKTASVAASWAALATSAEIELLDGDHYSIVRAPHVETLAKRLRRHLDHRLDHRLAALEGATPAVDKACRPVPAGPIPAGPAR